LLDLVPSLSLTGLEISNIDITLIVINVTGTDFIIRSVVDGLVVGNSVIISINVFLLEEDELVVVTGLVDL